MRRLLAFDAASEPGGFQSQRMHRNITDQFLDEGPAALPAVVGFGAIDSVSQFRDADHREASLHLAMDLFHLL